MKNELIIPSDDEGITKVESFLEKLAESYNIGNDLYGNILIALIEAVNNAMIHGNKCDKNKLVKIQITKNDNKYFFVVADEGQGFDFNRVPDPTSSENIEKPNGRGVFLMHKLADEIKYNEKGNEVHLTFYHK